jgi:hypothetical protein
MADLIERSLSELITGLRTGEISSQELTKAYLERIDGSTPACRLALAPEKPAQAGKLTGTRGGTNQTRRFAGLDCRCSQDILCVWRCARLWLRIWELCAVRATAVKPGGRVILERPIPMVPGRPRRIRLQSL